MRIAPVLLFLALACPAFASQLWTHSTDGAISAKPLAFQGAIVVASDDGNIYALESSSGALRWKASVGKTPNEVILADNAILASTSGGKVVKIGPTGNILWTADLTSSAFNVSLVYGAAQGARYTFVVTNKGLITVDQSGNAKNVYPMNVSAAGPPVAQGDFAIFGNSTKLLKITDAGLLQWSASSDGGSFWISRPLISGNGVFVGALDDKLHYYALNNGLEYWSASTRGWVAGSPLNLDGITYVGSDDGKVYAIDAGGQVKWSAQTQLAVQTKPEPGTMGGSAVIFVGGSDRSVYAISTDDGTIVWKGPANGAVGNPLFYQNMIIFGAGDGRVYAFSTERACSITTPHEADMVGNKELEVRGNYVSASGGATISIMINDGNWIPANTSENGSWVYYADPSRDLSPALNSISCKVTDAGGDESGEAFTTVTINYDPSTPKSDLSVTVSPNVMEKEPFTVFVNDADDGSPVDRFTLVYGTNEMHGDKSINLTISEPGAHALTVRKMGFNDATVSVNVNSTGTNPIFLVVGGIVILLLLLKVWGEMQKRKAYRK